MSVEIALAVAIVLLAICLLACWFAYRQAGRSHRQFETQSRQVGQALDRAARDLCQIQRAARQYPAGDPEPYGPVAKELDAQCTQIRVGCHQCLTQHRQLAARRHPAPANLLQRAWALLSSEYLHWRQREQEIGSLAESVHALNDPISQAQASLEQLRTLPLEAARRARDLYNLSAGMAPLVQALQRAGVHGTAFDQATAHAAQLHERLAQLPGWCTLQDDNQVLAQATPASTIQAWRLLDDLEGPIKEQRAALQGWQTLHREIAEGLQALQEALGQARMHRLRVPDSIDVEDRALQLNELEALSTELQARYRAPSAQDLEALHPQIPSAIKSARELDALFESVVRQFERLRQALGKVARLAHETQIEMDALAQATEYPIDWESHRATPVRLYHARDGLGALADRRTPERLAEHVRRADSLIAQGQALLQAVDRARNERTALVHLLAHPELAAQPAWLRQAGQLYAQVNRYGPENWPQELQVSNVLNDAQALDQRRQQWGPASAQAALPASRLGARLQETQELVEELASFEQRLGRIEERLAALQSARQAALQEMRRVDQALGRLLLALTNATPSIGRWTPLHGHQRQLEKARRTSGDLVAALARPGTERIEAGVRDVDRQMGALQKTLQRLLATLHAACKDQETELRDAVGELQSVASFEQEPAMQQALRQLQVKRPDTPPAPGRGRDATALQIATLVDDAVEALEERERLYLALGALLAQIKNRIEGQRTAATQAREEAQASYEALIELKRESERAWPPLQCDVQLAESLLASVERQEYALRNAGRTVSEVTYLLDQIAKGYQSLNDEAQSKIGQNGWQRQDVHTLWDRLGRWQASLASYSRAHQNEPNLSSAAHRWSQETAREVSNAQRSYGRSPMTHEQARRMLEDLWARVHDRDLPIRGQGTPLRARDVESEFPIS